MTESTHERHPDTGTPLTEAEFAVLKSYDEGPTPWTVTPELMARRMAWDMAPCPIAAEVTLKMGLPSASVDVDDMEHQAAHARLVRTVPLQQVLSVLNMTAANVMRNAMLVTHGDQIDGNPMLEVNALFSLLMNGSIATLAELMDMGMIGIPQQAGPHV